MKISTYTIIMLVGPSECGKSTYAKKIENDFKNQNTNIKVNILSSDNIRREILGEDLDKYDKKMLSVSDGAFELLFAKLKVMTTFPVNNDVIIIDSTGMDENFRNKVKEYAKNSHYKTALITFDYQNSEYYEHLSDHYSKTIVSKQVDKFKKNVLPRLNKKSYDYSIVIKSKKDFTKEVIELLDYDLIQSNTLTNKDFNNKDLLVIGDIHENIEPLIEMINSHKNKQIILVGDFLDKGANTEKTINYIYELLNDGAKIVLGNHESFVGRRLKNSVAKIENEEEIFSSLKVLNYNDDLKNKFLQIYEKCYPYLKIEGYGFPIYITHAPCENKYLGKIDATSQRMQRNYYFAYRENDKMLEELMFISKEANFHHPVHIFGHVAHQFNKIENKNKVWLDTGSVYGNYLSGLVINTSGFKKHIKVKSEKRFEGELLTEKKVENLNINDLNIKYNLNYNDRVWLNKFMESNAKFISGTMSPSKSNDKLEPIQTALDYYYHHKIDKVIIEPKYMGSRLQVYLHKDKNKDFAITRNGNKLSLSKELQEIFDKLHHKYDGMSFWKEQIIFDGEILPWSFIAEDLITKEFYQYGKTIKNELAILKNDNMFIEFNIDANINKKYEMVNVFLDQAYGYGKNYPIEYKPFSILKVDDEIWVDKNQEDIFKMVNDDNYLVIETNNLNYEKAIEFFNKITSKNNNDIGNEGVIVKPLIWKEGVAPYIKVRNEDYLHIIYGYDYKLNYDEMVKTKKINKKLEMSIKEYELGIKMLKSQNSQELMNLACEIYFEIAKENQLDVRL